jgi:hypothetical protein
MFRLEKWQCPVWESKIAEIAATGRSLVVRIKVVSGVGIVDWVVMAHLGVNVPVLGRGLAIR